MVSLRPGALCLFDRDYAHKIVDRLAGGRHYDLGQPGSAGFHVFGRIDAEAERTWAMTWLEPVLIGEGLAPDPHERQEMWEALGRLAGLAPEQRTLSMYRRLLQVPRLKFGLTPFCAGGPYGYFDAREDSFSLDTRRVCFEMATLLTQPRAIGPALSYLFHRLETQWFHGDPVRITIEEARWMPTWPPFLGELEVYLKARLKKNVNVTLVCQEVYDLQRTAAGRPFWPPCRRAFCCPTRLPWSPT